MWPLLICDQWLTKSLGQKTLGRPLIWLNGHSSVLLQFLEFINIYFLFELHTLESKKGGAEWVDWKFADFFSE